MLGVRWHLEHLAVSSDEKILCLLPVDDVYDEPEADETDLSLVTWRMFC